MLPDKTDRGIATGAKNGGIYNELEPFGPMQVLTPRSTKLSAHLFPKLTQDSQNDRACSTYSWSNGVRDVSVYLASLPTTPTPP